jgi:N-acetylneuraminic acid mutarotase
MPTRRAGLAAAVIGTKIYAIGGRTASGGPCSGGELDTVERFDTDSETWTTLASLPTPRSDAAGIAVKGKVYVFGGCRRQEDDSITVLSRIDIYDPATDAWTTSPDVMPGRRAAFYQVGVSGRDGPASKIYLIGGWKGTGIGERTVIIYDVATGGFTWGRRMPTARAEMGVAWFDDRIYAVGGAQPGFGTPVRAVEVFRP